MRPKSLCTLMCEVNYLYQSMMESERVETVETRDVVEGSGVYSSDPDILSGGEPVLKRRRVASIKRKYSGDQPVNKEITICI